MMYDIYMIVIETHLKRVRLKNRLTIEDMARRAMISVKTARNAEKPGYVPSFRVQRAIAGVFEISPEVFWPIDCES